MPTKKDNAITITKSYTKSDDLVKSELILTITGETVNNIILNTIRRTLYENIPIYAFDPHYMIIDKNTSYQNNDQLKLRLSMIPIVNIYSDLIWLDEMYWNKINYGNEEELPSEQIVEFYINKTNESDLFQYVTTDDFKCFIDGKEVQNPYNKKYPYLITKLRHKEELICKITGKIRIGKVNTIWSPVYKTYYVYDENIFKLIIHSYGQLTEYELFNRACDNVIYQLNTFKILINKYINNYDTNTDISNKIEIKFNDKTIANLINNTLQEHKLIKFSGIHIPTYLDNEVLINIECAGNIKSLEKILHECVDTNINVFEELKKAIK